MSLSHVNQEEILGDKALLTHMAGKGERVTVRLHHVDHQGQCLSERRHQVAVWAAC